MNSYCLLETFCFTLLEGFFMSGWYAVVCMAIHVAQSFSVNLFLVFEYAWFNTEKKLSQG